MRDLEKLWLISVDLPDGASYRHTRGLRTQLVPTVETTVGFRCELQQAIHGARSITVSDSPSQEEHSE